MITRPSVNEELQELHAVIQCQRFLEHFAASIGAPISPFARRVGKIIEASGVGALAHDPQHDRANKARAGALSNG